MCRAKTNVIGSSNFIDGEATVTTCGCMKTSHVFATTEGSPQSALVIDAKSDVALVGDIYADFVFPFHEYFWQVICLFFSGHFTECYAFVESIR